MTISYDDAGKRRIEANPLSRQKYLILLDSNRYVSSPVTVETTNRNFAAVFPDLEEAQVVLTALYGGAGEIVSL